MIANDFLLIYKCLVSIRYFLIKNLIVYFYPEMIFSNGILVWDMMCIFIGDAF